MKKPIGFILLLILTGCGPVIRKVHIYEPVKTESQRTCIMSCQMLKQSCTMNQQQTHQLCKANARLEYQSCKSSELWGYNKKGKYECIENCYCYESFCSEPDKEECEDQYASCYRGCGGKVTESMQCVSNCE